MKNFYLFLLLFSFCAAPKIQGQEGFYIGVGLQGHGTFILNQNTYGYTLEPDYKVTLGINSSLKLGYMITEVSGIQFELGYTKAGQNYEDVFRINGNSTEVTKEIDLSYINLGLLYRMSLGAKKDAFNNTQNIRFSLVSGIQLGILNSANLEVVAGTNEITSFPVPGPLTPANIISYSYDERPNDDKDLFKTLDVGLIIQPGVDFYVMDRLFITTSLRTYFGFTDINAADFTAHPNYSASRNFNLGIRVGLGYNITYK